MSETIDPAHHKFLATHNRGTLVTIRRNGRPQLSNVLYDYDAATDTASSPRCRARERFGTPFRRQPPADPLTCV